MKQILIISPHPDDVSFALGGTLIKNKEFVINVLNIFSDKTYNVYKIDESKIKKIIIDEELRASKEMNVKSFFANFKDAQLRGYKRLSEILGKKIQEDILQKEAQLICEVKKYITDFISKSHFDYIGVCMACGEHVDHVITRNVVMELFNELNFNLFLYEDMPYSINKKWKKMELNSLKKSYKLRNYQINIAGCIERKRHLLQIYHSQVKTRDIKMIINYAGQIVNGMQLEQIWIVGRKELTRCLNENVATYKR